ncbi:MAG: hypothetical protein GIW98_06575, partial [Candidatus Eremiobacteraeota bacterium]|nr:hypothetical protein [Candidatus Eremiobacteraeota bacterium]
MPFSPRTSLKRQRFLIIAIVISIAIHFIIGPFFSRWHALQITQGRPQPEFVITSSSVKLERHATPQPQAQKKLRIEHQQTPRQRIRQQIVTPRMRVELTPPPHELARLNPNAVEHQPLPPKAQPVQQQSQTQREQQQFEKAIAQAKAQGNPLNVSPAPAAAPKRYALEFNGKNNPLQSGEGILYPRKTYKEAGETCYYVDYTMVFSDGARDEGRVPWPICYLPKTDPFVNNFQHFPLPSPRPGYVLPPS